MMVFTRQCLYAKAHISEAGFDDTGGKALKIAPARRACYSHYASMLYTAVDFGPRDARLFRDIFVQI